MNIFTNIADLFNFRKIFTSETRSTPRHDYVKEKWKILSSDTTVNEEKSLGLSAVFSAVNMISNHLASLPFEILEEMSNGQTKKRNDTQIARLLRKRPNNYTTAFTFQKTLFSYFLLWGNGYARINRNNNFRPTSIHLIHPAYVRPYIYKGSKYYYITNTGEKLFDSDMIHIMNMSLNGIEGISVIQQQRENIEVGTSAQRFGKDFFKKGGHVGGTIQVPQELGEDAFKRMKDEYQEFQGEDNAHKIMLLEGGAEYNKIGIPPEDAQFVETRRFTNEEIARMFNIPNHKINLLENASFSNIEQQSIEYVQDCLLPIAENAEQEFAWKLIFKREQNNYRINKNFDSLLRGDISTRKDYYKTMFDIGVFSQNDILTREGENPIKNGDRHYIPANNLVPIERIDDYIDANMKANKNNSQ